ncbi:MAG: UDP-N-acetylmuramoyl-L-alanine--D-glutamate ligase [Deltaproteobacteria bacterium]|nr:UDP-N-acetylmuramoyl-L-alanine--D-glutamate ligase [Deltaproteobacteria bacterium]
MEKGLNIRGKRVVVVGLGRSGSAAALWLSKRGAVVTVSDLRPASDFPSDALQEIRDAGILLELGGHAADTFLHADWIVLSPGVPPEIEPIRSARNRGISVFGEMELACRLLDIPMAGVTGTNGKSTVTALLGEMLRNRGERVFVGGNIGTPLMDLVTGRRAYDRGVIEVSSFQLDTMESFQPEVSVILNVSPDHLDRYQDYEAYVQSKLRIFRHQRPGDAVVLNDDDPRLQKVEPAGHLRVLRYGVEEAPHRAAWIGEGRVIARLPDAGPVSFSLAGFALPGEHNRENLMAAVLAAMAMGAGRDAVQKGIDRFRGLPHRLEFVGRAKGVAFYDDSKATNVDAAARAVESFEQPLVLIAGGRHKGGDYGPLVRAARGRVKGAVFLGEARRLLAEAFDGAVPYRIAGTMDEAVSESIAQAGPGDVILLAPACSSFDMFQDYAHRGRAFSEAARRFMDGDEEA